MNRQRDAIGLIAFDDHIIEMLPPSARAGHLTSILVTLDRLTLGNQTECGEAAQDLAEAIRKRGLVVLISDLLDDPSRVLDGLKHFRYRGTEVIVFQILDPAELRFPFERAARFRDIETATKCWPCPTPSAGSISRRSRELQERYRRDLHLAGIDYVMLDTSVPLETG